MTSRRQRVLDTLNHKLPDRVPLDFGATSCSGIHCSVVAELRDHFGLEKRLVTIHEPFQMLGYIEDDLADALGIDTAIAMPVGTMFGDVIDGKWKEWRTLWGQTVLIPESMQVENLANGEAVVYPQGDKSIGPCARMPATGYFFDAIIRQGEFDEDDPNPEDNLEEFQPLTPDVLDRMVLSAKVARASGRAVVSGLPGTAMGDIAMVPAMNLKAPKGIRDISEWYMSTAARQDFIHAVFSKQTEIALQNLAAIHKAVGDMYDAVFVCGTDFGTQISTFCSKDTFLELYSPYYRKINDWIHANTSWKTFKHSCGAIESFIEGLIASGFDILNPVQCSATGMDAATLKQKYGERLVFWGGGVDTQKVLPFGSPEEVREQVLERCRIFSQGGGFVFNTIHNVQAKTPLANMTAMLRAVEEFNGAGK